MITFYPTEERNNMKDLQTSATVIAYGEVLWDLLPSGPVLGGAPLNFMYRVTSLGLSGAMISKLGNNNYGRQALQQMQELGLRTDFIQRTSNFPTGTVNITLNEDKSPNFTIVPNVAYDTIDYNESLGNLAKHAECLCFGSVAQRSEHSRNTLMQLLDAFTGLYALYDINLRKDCYTADIIRASISRSTILKLNDGEVPAVARIYDLPATLPEFVEGLFTATPLSYCLITLGSQGAFAASKSGERIYVPAYQVTLVDTCGAGDAFTAGFLATFLQRQNLWEACRVGNALGAMVAEQPGATQPIKPEAVQEFMQNREHSPIFEPLREYYAK
jgi:fructokinase